jgi:hypothetical protein
MTPITGPNNLGFDLVLAIFEDGKSVNVDIEWETVKEETVKEDVDFEPGNIVSWGVNDG